MLTTCINKDKEVIMRYFVKKIQKNFFKFFVLKKTKSKKRVINIK